MLEPGWYQAEGRTIGGDGVVLYEGNIVFTIRQAGCAVALDGLPGASRETGVDFDADFAVFELTAEAGVEEQWTGWLDVAAATLSLRRVETVYAGKITIDFDTTHQYQNVHRPVYELEESVGGVILGLPEDIRVSETKGMLWQ